MMGRGASIAPRFAVEKVPMTDRDYNAPPLNPLPGIVWALALPLIAVELVVQLHALGLAGGGVVSNWRLEAVQYFAFVPDWFRDDLATGRLAERGYRVLSYLLVNPSLTSTVFAVVMLLALGKMVGEVFRWWATALVFLAAGAAGALAFAYAIPGNQTPIIGTFPAVYGLIGAFTFMLWVRLAATGGTQARAFALIAFLLGFQMFFSLAFDGGLDWVADLAGFGTGFLLSFLVSPGGWARVRARLRER
jgi:membrane associated rhomboid family serine protease